MYDHNDDNIYEMADFQDILDETTSKDLESYDMQTQMKMVSSKLLKVICRKINGKLQFSLPHYVRICCLNVSGKARM